ncbi:hypothetical protein PSSM2_047 [Prochlorococcus phage P-SSM2]|jgi:hypothetical protein|uniref:Uncharacterized protein n=1 Tax=Prochlorococcus phage P-SSM2 TaxID=268746 RepID=Q58MV7_BPPRM|nr:hypothetical protein PSSM2_047 [Prochlorococcus phage P-SSM2]AAX44425.1 hypothetical protein PSSM2_047 [Prochlorococcus phage P-SSM2]ACY75923.1 conserved hypothetical protein [Prochlorococcus phage P-SSM2]
MNNEELRKEINEIIEADIQIALNDYIQANGGGEKGEKLTAKVSQAEVDKIIKEYKKIKKRENSPLGVVKKMGLLDKDGRPL